MSSAQQSATERALRAFIVEELLVEPYGGVDPLAEEAVDSLGLEQLTVHIEEAFGVELADEEMTGEHFASLALLAALVDSKR